MECQIFLLQFRTIRTFIEHGMIFDADKSYYVSDHDAHEITDDELVTSGNALEDWFTLTVFLTRDEAENALTHADQSKYKHRVHEAKASGILAEIIDNHNEGK